MKIAIVANCQGESLMPLFHAMNPEVQVVFHIVTKLWNGEVVLDELYRDFDIVIGQSFIRQYASENQLKKTVIIPSLAFSAFHPDLTYARGRVSGGDVETAFTPLAHYHSALIIYGFKRGFSVDETIALFSECNFKKLGYIDRWAKAKAELLEEAAQTDIDLSDVFKKWERSGCFMHSFNHPVISVLEDLARCVLEKIGIERVNNNPSRYIADPLKSMPVWPIYPGVADQFGLHGDYAFKIYEPQGVLSLTQFVEASFSEYEKFDADSLEALNVDISLFNALLAAPDMRNYENPYSKLPPSQFWKKAVADVSPDEFDPVVSTRFAIRANDLIATAGSCFAQHIARTLQTKGYNYYVPEAAPLEMDPELARAKNFGVFSARFGNIYTARQLLQLMERCSGRFKPTDSAWLHRDGGFVDPFRPQIEPAGFQTIEELEASREEHFRCVQTMFREMDVFIFTLGLTEGWRSKIDGAVFPLAPGVAGGIFDSEQYEFVNFGISEIVGDLRAFLDGLKEYNKHCRIMLTVSPVPLIATYEPKNVLVATTYSKSVLRVAAEELYSIFDYVDYFPSFEIITGNFNKGAYFENDLRSVKEIGVNHVMRLFSKHYLSSPEEDVKRKEKLVRVSDIVCDEEAIARI